MNKNETLIKRIGSHLKKFKLKEYGVLLEMGFLNISLEKIYEDVTKLRLYMTSTSVAQVCTEFIRRKQKSIDELETLFNKIFTYDVAFHPSRSLKWAAGSFDQEIKELPETLDDLNNVIVNAYNAHDSGITVNAFSVYHNKIVWTVIFPKEKLKKGGFRSKAPILFAYKPSLELPHFLYSPPKLQQPTVHFEVYTASLGYDGFSLLEFEGTDAIGMFDLIEKGNQLVELPIYNHVIMDVEEQRLMANMSGSFDYSHSKERKEYANKIFTRDTRQYFKVVCDGTLLDEGPASNLSRSRSRNENIEFLSSMEFSTSGNTSVEGMLKHLISIGAVKMPVPEYLLQISTTPSNSVTIHHETHLQPNNS